MTKDLLDLIKEKTTLSTKSIESIITLINDGCTIPFIARYRKDATGNASDEDLRAFEEVFNYSQKLLKRKEDILNLLEEKKFLNEKVKSSINQEKLYKP